MTHPPSGPSNPPPPPGPKANTQTPARRDLESQVPGFPAVATTGGPVSSRPIREESPTSPSVDADSEGRAGLTPPGAVPFTLPPPPGLPRFGDGRPTPGQPPTPPRPTGPVPHPPPPRYEFPPPVLGEGQLFDVPGETWRALSVDCDTWPSSRRS